VAIQQCSIGLVPNHGPQLVSRTRRIQAADFVRMLYRIQFVDNTLLATRNMGGGIFSFVASRFTLALATASRIGETRRNG
jgi:hypothetical protein